MGNNGKAIQKQIINALRKMNDESARDKPSQSHDNS